MNNSTPLHTFSFTKCVYQGFIMNFFKNKRGLFTQNHWATKFNIKVHLRDKETASSLVQSLQKCAVFHKRSKESDLPPMHSPLHLKGFWNTEYWISGKKYQSNHSWHSPATLPLTFLERSPAPCDLNHIIKGTRTFGEKCLFSFLQINHETKGYSQEVVSLA